MTTKSNASNERVTILERALEMTCAEIENCPKPYPHCPDCEYYYIGPRSIGACWKAYLIEKAKAEVENDKKK